MSLPGRDTDPIGRLIGELSRLPGVGEKTAARLAYHILRQPKSLARNLANALNDVCDKVRLCSQCQNLTAEDPCFYCRDPKRDGAVICVVESVQALRAIDRTGEFRGRFHVLHGALSPLDGVGPDDLHIQELVDRIEQGGVSEVICALNPTLEGDATTLYLQRLVTPLGVKLTRLAHGVAVGSDLEYTDQATLVRALSGRREV
jgi:recombination protein RecR